MITASRFFLLTIALLFGAASHAQEAEVSWSAFTSGFGVLTDGITRVEAITGQPFTGELEGPDISVGTGFLYNPDITQQQFSLSVSLQEGWNLLSLPVTRDSSNDSVRQVFPDATYEHAFAYIPGSGYVQEPQLGNRIGYWIKFPAAAPAYLSGGERPSDTLYVEAGWNLVGSISAPVDTASVISDPPGNRISLWFGYSGGFAPADLIQPGHGYWVKAAVGGTFFLPGSSSRPERVRGSSPLTELNTLTVTDASGHTQTLYFGDATTHARDTGLYELPPGAPEGAFDVRFESQRMVENVLAGTAVSLHAGNYPLILHWEVNTDSRFAVRFGNERPVAMAGRGELQITDPAVTRVVIEPATEAVPAVFRLDQNYPNPFNPTTTIQYTVPGDAGTLHATTLHVYDILGRQVATLVNAGMEAGQHVVRFDASRLASGVYVYRLQSGSETRQRRMLLLR